MKNDEIQQAESVEELPGISNIPSGTVPMIPEILGNILSKTCPSPILCSMLEVSIKYWKTVIDNDPKCFRATFRFSTTKFSVIEVAKLEKKQASKEGQKKYFQALDHEYNSIFEGLFHDGELYCANHIHQAKAGMLDQAEKPQLGKFFDPFISSDVVCPL